MNQPTPSQSPSSMLQPLPSGEVPGTTIAQIHAFIDWKSVETGGSKVLAETAFPGEPQDMPPALRTNLWALRFISEKKALVSLVKRKKSLQRTAAIIENVGITSSIIGGLSSCIGIMSCMPHPTPSPYVVLPMIAGSFIVPLAILAYVTWLLCNRYRISAGHVEEFLDRLSTTWPRRFKSILMQAVDREIHLSQELHALLALFKKTTGTDQEIQESAWDNLTTLDSIAMITLADSLMSKITDLPRDASLGLSGESSELVHRACAAAFPGRLETLLDYAANPPSVKV